MAIERQYTEPLQIVDTQETRDRLDRIADARKVSRARVIRELIAAGIDAAERDAGVVVAGQ